MSALAEFHFLYPYWFLALPLVLFFWWWLSQQNTQSKAWQHFIDEHLRPFVISGGDSGNSRWLRHGLLLASLVTIVALAGPTWQKRQLPAFQTQQGLVLVLDLSASMLATDVKPNRINRARFKLLDLLKIRQEGQTGLVVFAGDAFAVSPLTDDVENIIEQAKNLSPSIMPTQGSLIYRGIDEALLLLQQAGYVTGDILVITDGVSNLPRALQSAEASAQSGYQVSIAAIGTKQGAPIPVSSSDFFRDQQGQLIMAKLDTLSLQEIAKKGNGVFQKLSLADGDIESFQQFFSGDKSSLLDDKKTTVEHWHNEGVWLLWLLLLPVLLLFRKGYLFSVAVCVLVLGFFMPQPASAFSWDELWLNADQRAHRALLDKKHDQAKALFKSPEWKASAAYRNGDFDESANLFGADNTANGHYNKANALAKAGKTKEAIEAYEQALALQNDHADAKFNLDLLKKMQEEKEQKQQGKDQDSEQDKDKKDQKDKQQGQDGQDKNNEGQQDHKNPKEGEENQKNQQSEEEKKKAETAKQQAEEEAKKRAEEEKKAKAEKKENKADKKEGQQKPKEDEMTEEQKQQAKQTKQWLHKIPDDSAGLWRRKFQYQYRQRQPAGSGDNTQGQQPW